MRNLILLLIAFIAVVTFIRAFDRTETINDISNPPVIEAGFSN